MLSFEFFFSEEGMLFEENGLLFGDLWCAYFLSEE